MIDFLLNYLYLKKKYYFKIKLIKNGIKYLFLNRQNFNKHSSSIITYN